MTDDEDRTELIAVRPGDTVLNAQTTGILWDYMMEQVRKLLMSAAGFEGKEFSWEMILTAAQAVGISAEYVEACRYSPKIPPYTTFRELEQRLKAGRKQLAPKGGRPPGVRLDGEKLRRLRADKEYTQTQFCRHKKLSVDALGKAEASLPIAQATANKIAKRCIQLRWITNADELQKTIR